MLSDGNNSGAKVLLLISPHIACIDDLHGFLISGSCDHEVDMTKNLGDGICGNSSYAAPWQRHDWPGSLLD